MGVGACGRFDRTALWSSIYCGARLVVAKENDDYFGIAPNLTLVSRLVKDFLAEQKGAISLEYLPAYAPELNPVEYLWG